MSNPDEPKKKAPPPTIQWDPNQGPPSTDPEPPAEESEKAGPQPTIQWDPAQGPSQPTPEPHPTPQPTPTSPPPAPTAFDEDEDPLVGTLLRDLKLPSEVRIGSINRDGKVTIARADDTITLGDRVIDKITLDPNGRFPDSNTLDNIWKR